MNRTRSLNTFHIDCMLIMTRLCCKSMFFLDIKYNRCISTWSPISKAVHYIQFDLITEFENYIMRSQPFCLFSLFVELCPNKKPVVKMLMEQPKYLVQFLFTWPYFCASLYWSITGKLFSGTLQQWCRHRHNIIMNSAFEQYFYWNMYHIFVVFKSLIFYDHV